MDFGGINLTDRNLTEIDFPSCIGLNAESLPLADIPFTKLPTLNFVGIDFSRFNLKGVDLSLCTGIPTNQIMAASDFLNVKLPVVDFTGF